MKKPAQNTQDAANDFDVPESKSASAPPATAAVAPDKKAIKNPQIAPVTLPKKQEDVSKEIESEVVKDKIPNSLAGMFALLKKINDEMPERTQREKALKAKRLAPLKAAIGKAQQGAPVVRMNADTFTLRTNPKRKKHLAAKLNLNSKNESHAA